MNLAQLRRLADEKLTELKSANAMLKQERKLRKLAEKKLKTALEAQKLIQAIASATQSKVHEKIATVVTKCLRIVYEKPYTFVIHFEQKRGKTEARMVFVDEHDNEMSPRRAAGGMLDVASFGLRLSALMLTRPHARRLLVLDEPFRFAGAYREKIRSMLEQLAVELDVQFVIVTHDKELMAGSVVEL